jgi:hypothetical protein
MRALRALCCAVAISACLAPGARADEFTKQTYLTFSGPVQLPGVTLAPGTYMFKLADPETGRRAIQVWDKEGTKLYTTLLTIPDQRMKVTDTPVVMFNERPSGEAQAIRSWFYPDESYGFEFIYPKAQATKLAKENHSSVLAFNDEGNDPSAFKSAKIGRVDENGNMIDANKAATTASNDANKNAPAATSPSASASTTTARNDTAPMPQPPATTTSRSNGTVGTSGTNSARANTAPVATSGSAVGSQANRTNQADRGANAAAGNTANRQLPRTAGSTTMIELMGVLALAAAAGIRSLRLRQADLR